MSTKGAKQKERVKNSVGKLKWNNIIHSNNLWKDRERETGNKEKANKMVDLNPNTPKITLNKNGLHTPINRHISLEWKKQNAIYKKFTLNIII